LEPKTVTTISREPCYQRKTIITSQQITNVTHHDWCLQWHKLSVT